MFVGTPIERITMMIVFACIWTIVRAFSRPRAGKSDAGPS